MGNAGVEPGQVLAGKYRIDRVLGEGGMGVVVAAHHLQLDQQVAIKFLLPEALRNADAVARFGHEARAAVKIKSEHVARVIDVGTLETGAPYIVMEYLQGADLEVVLEKNGPLPVVDAVDFTLQTCEALADAHALGIIHRDLKPANLFCIRGSDGLQCIKVLDFGISKLTGAGGAGAGMGMTRTTAVMGSPLYMSPEQMQSSRNVDVRTDIWAVGVILYELLAGKPPFLGESIPELCMKIMTAAPEPLVRVRGDVPAGLESVILRCLAKDRTQRYPHVAALAVDLRPFAPPRSKISVERAWRILSASSPDLLGSLPPAIRASAGPRPPVVIAQGPSPGNTAQGREGGPPILAEDAASSSWGRTARKESPRPARHWAVFGALAVSLALLAAGGISALRRSTKGSWTDSPTAHGSPALAVSTFPGNSNDAVGMPAGAGRPIDSASAVGTDRSTTARTTAAGEVAAGEVAAAAGAASLAGATAAAGAASAAGAAPAAGAASAAGAAPAAGAASAAGAAPAAGATAAARPLAVGGAAAEASPSAGEGSSAAPRPHAGAGAGASLAGTPKPAPNTSVRPGKIRPTATGSPSPIPRPAARPPQADDLGGRL